MVNGRRAFLALVMLVMAGGTRATALGPEFSGRRGADQSDRAVAALDRYAAGDFAGAVASLVDGRSLGAAAGNLRRRAPTWVEAADAARRPQRWLTVAALAVEVMAASYDRDFWEYRDARVLADWACERLRRMPPSDGERWFHLAAIALAQGGDDQSFVTGYHTFGASVLVGRMTGPHHVTPSGESHARHAAERFPDEPRFPLAFAVSWPSLLHLSPDPLTPYYIASRNKGYSVGIETDGEKSVIEGLQARYLRPLHDDPIVGPEARLHSGVLRVLLQDPGGGTELLQTVLDAPDHFVRHLGHLMLAALADRQGDVDATLRHYRAANEISRAQTSAIALASALYRSGRSDEAADVLKRVEGQPLPPDPWRLYSQRDYRHYPEYRDRLRQTIHP